MNQTVALLTDYFDYGGSGQVGKAAGWAGLGGACLGVSHSDPAQLDPARLASHSQGVSGPISIHARLVSARLVRHVLAHWSSSG